MIMANIRFYLDEHIARAVTGGLRQRGVDVKTVAEADLLGASDEKHLEFARTESRVIFTQDADFLNLVSQDQNHPGICVCIPTYAHPKNYLGLNADFPSSGCGRDAKSCGIYLKSLC